MCGKWQSANVLPALFCYLYKKIIPLTIAFYSRQLVATDLAFLQPVFDWLKQQQVNLLIHQPYFESLTKALPVGTLANAAAFTAEQDLTGQADFMVSLGGDGTMLDTVALIRNSQLPVLGINTGRLGFLASINRDAIEKSLEAALNGEYELDRRSLVQLDSTNGLFGQVNYGLNEFTIHKNDTGSMIVIHTYLNGEFMNSYWADGLMVSTPTGSTGYNLSCGGPIVFPSSENFIITPVASHNLNIRPLVVPDSAVISFEVETRSERFLCSLDSRVEYIEPNVQLAIRKAPFSFNLVRLHDTNFLQTLSNKLNWGLDKRN